MFKKILFATTGSPTCDDAAKTAFDLAKTYDAVIYVLHVFGIPTRGASRFVTDVRTGQEETTDADYAAWVMEEMKTTYAAQLEGTPKAVIECSVGSPATEILRKAWKEDVDLIVMGAHTSEEDAGAYRFRQIAGSTMQRVARLALCPVMIVSRPCEACFRHANPIVFGTDFSRAATAAFKFACRTAEHTGSRLFLFHAIDLRGTGLGRTRDQADIEQRIAVARRSMQQLYVQRMTGFDDYEIEIREGIPPVKILEFAQEKSAALIILAHHSREIDPQKALLGSTVDKVALDSICPVISVNRPDRVHRPGAGRERVDAEPVQE